ncbi:MAG: hypothetical protein ACE5KX_01585 [Acidimicrobiia bacterium]
MRSRFSKVLLAAVVSLVGLVVPLQGVLASIRTSERVIVRENDVVAEDLYAVGGRVIVEGVIEGDLIVVTGSLTMTGVVEGDVVGLIGGTAVIGGEVQGSVRIAALRLVADGRVGNDLSAAAVSGKLSGDVGRDALLTAGTSTVRGSVGRDVRGQFWRLTLDGSVGRDVIVSVQRLRANASTDVEGDLSYRSSNRGTISAGAEVAGQLVRRSGNRPVWVRAVTRLVSVLSLLAFIVSGIVLFWLFRDTTPRATTATLRKPWWTLLVGLALLVLPPLAVVPLFFTLVGIPIAVLILVLWLLGLFLGPVPAVALAGDKLLRGRGGMLGGFVVGAVVWRGAIWLLPLVGALLYVVTLVLGLGSWGIGAWEARRARPPAPEPPVGAPGAEVEPEGGEAEDDDWAPLPPEPKTGEEEAEGPSPPSDERQYGEADDPT